MGIRNIHGGHIQDHMPTMVTTMARDPLMLSQRLMLMPITDMLTHMPMVLDMPTMDITDTHMPTTVTTMARDPLMLSQRLMLMLTTDTTHMPMDTILDMPTMDTTDTHMPTTATDTTTKMFFKS